jgi:hypothetical protein
MRKRVCLTVLLVGFAMTFSGPSASAQNCSPRVIPRAKIGITPDTGQVSPDFLATEGQQITVHGVAERFTLSQDCAVSIDPLPFRWSMQYRPPGGLLSEVTSELDASDQLTPRFHAKLGTYIILLETLGPPSDARSSRAILEVVRRGGWVSIGPDGRYLNQTSPQEPVLGSLISLAGRINTIAIHPNTPNVMYAGAARGGVWRSDNGGADWWPMTDHKGLPSGLAIGRLAVTPAGRVYASLPDNEGGVRYFGLGPALFSSDDDGVTWQQVVTDPTCSPVSSVPQGTITRIIIDPTSPTTVFAASGSGVFRSIDNGKCWVNILLGQAVLDLALLQQTPGETILYAATSGSATIGASVIRTLNANAATSAVTWQSTPETLKTAPTGAAVSTIPAFTAPVSRIALASSKDVVYAVVAQGPPRAAKGQLLFLRTTITGSWVQRAEPLDSSLSNRCDGQCSYNLSISANHLNEDDVVVGTVTVFRSTDGGKSWSEFNPGSTSLWDHHALVHHPTDPDLLFSGNDVGIQMIRPSLLGTSQGLWTYPNGGLSNGLFEGLALAHGGTPTRSAGGLQDAGTLLHASGRVWSRAGGGDGKYTAFDGGNNYPIYFTSNLSTSGGSFERGGGSSPLKGLGNAAAFWTDPITPGVLIAATPVIPIPNGSQPQTTLTGLYYASAANSAANINWQCIDPTPANPGTFSGAIAFLPGGGQYLVGTTAGAVFRLVAPTVAVSSSTACSSATTTSATPLWTAPALPGGGPSPVIGLALDPTAPTGAFYVTLARYDASRVMRVRRMLTPTSDGGLRVTWQASPIAGNPGDPDVFPSSNDSCCPGQFGFVSPIAADPDNTGTLYVGTGKGLAVGVRQPDDTWHWSMEQDVPETWVTDIQTRAGTGGRVGVVRTATYGRGVFEHVNGLRLSTLVGTRLFDIRAVEISDTDHQSSELTVAIDYSYDGSQGRSVGVRIHPVGAGAAGRFFVSTPVHLTRGSGTALVSLYYAGARAPLELSTRGLYAELLDGKGKVLAKKELILPQRWKPLGSHRVLVSAELIPADGPPIPVSLQVQRLTEGRPSLLDTPKSFVVPVPAEVRLLAPRILRASQNGRMDPGINVDAAFVGWKGVSGRAGLNPELKLDVQEDQEVTAVYAIARKDQRDILQ